MMNKLLFLLLLCLSTALHAETWVHFKQGVNYYDAYWTLKNYKYTLKNQKDRPYRISVYENLTPTQVEELKKDPAIVEVNYSSDAIYQLPHYSKWGLTPEQTKKWTTYGAYGSVGLVTLHGIAMWDWFQSGIGFDFGREWWFSAHSYSGGADKTGHLMSYYFQKRALNWMFIQMGNDLDTANNYSTIVAGMLGFVVEVGDGFSNYLFSYEDVIMDLVGVMFAYYADKYPWFDELIGLKWEYWPSVDQKRYEKNAIHNPTSDYSGQKYWISLKGTGIPAINHTWGRYASLDFGYYTRGYIPHSGPSEWTPPYRAYSLSLSLNLSEIVFGVAPRSQATTVAARALKYWQPPTGQFELYGKKMRAPNVQPSGE